MTQTWQIEVQETNDGELYINLPDEILSLTNMKEGDTIDWTDNKDGSFTLNKIEETELVLVECIQQYRMRYVIEVPKGKELWALDTVVMEEVDEFSQLSLGETIVSHRVVTKEEVLNLCDIDNEYCQSWTDEKKLDVFTKRIKTDE